jgi:hypothetical protein
MLGERLETRGLWVEFKKGQLIKLPIPDFRKIDQGQLREIFQKGHLDDFFATPLPSVRDYIKAMANIEASSMNYRKTIEEALNDPLLKPRAALDKISFKLLHLLGCETVPERIYQLVSNEIDSLRQIMEAAPGESQVVRDRGAAAIRGINDKYQRKLGDYSDT